MSRRARLLLFALAGAGLAVVLLFGFGGLPRFGYAHEVTGALVNRTEPELRHATDIVTALNFDLRAFDTLGEEFILFGSVSGVALLLRHLRDESEAERSTGIEDHRFAGASDALRATSLILIPLIIALGAYIVLHGQLTPGGGFQGGVVLAAGPIAILLAGRYLSLKRAAPDWLLEALDSFGAASYALIGVGGLIIAGIYLKNFLGLGTQGKLISGGMMPLNSFAVGIEVTGAFLLTWTEFLDQALVVADETRARQR
ncbi:MAG: MnhB domain-containing protein [Solirubrobacteraceae bacterium]